MFVDIYVDKLILIMKGTETMNMGKTVLAQRKLINFCREHGYTDMKFIGVDCVSAVDPTGTARILGVNFNGEVVDMTTKEVLCE